MRDDWPAWATERIEIVDPDPAWAQQATGLIDDLEPRLSPWTTGRIEHVGSTAVPGLAAKPLIDLLAPVASLEASADAQEALTPAGWELVPPELDARPWRRLHVLAPDGRRVAHLQLVEPGHRRWDETLAFRDRLREQPQLADAYARLKRSAARTHAGDREAYTRAKVGFIESVLHPRT